MPRKKGTVTSREVAEGGGTRRGSGGDLPVVFIPGNNYAPRRKSRLSALAHRWLPTASVVVPLLQVL